MSHIIHLKRCLAIFFTCLLSACVWSPLWAGDCLHEVWPLVFDSSDGPPSIYNWGEFRGECEYGVDFTPPTVAFMQMPVQEIFDQAFNGPYSFEFVIYIGNLYSSMKGNVRIFELGSTLPAVNNDGEEPFSAMILGVNLGWNRVNRTSLSRFYLRGAYSEPNPIFQDRYEDKLLIPDMVEVPIPDNHMVHVKLIWWPASSIETADGSIELWANETLISERHGLRLTTDGIIKPNIVRYGILSSDDKDGSGTLRIRPSRPTPFVPSID